MLGRNRGGGDAEGAPWRTPSAFQFVDRLCLVPNLAAALKLLAVRRPRRAADCVLVGSDAPRNRLHRNPHRRTSGATTPPCRYW